MTETDYNVDEQGNLLSIPEAIEASDEEQAKNPTKRPSDFNLAKQVVEAWGKPIAFHAGEAWSFTIERGWEVFTNKILALCNKLRGQETSKTVFAILCNQLRTPDMQHVQETSTYWLRDGGVWDGDWVPFNVSSSGVVFANGILDLVSNVFTELHSSVIFGPRITVPYTGMGETCTEFEKLLENGIPDEETRKYFQKICSLVMQPHVILRGQIVLWGVPYSGKTTIATAISCAPAGLVGASFLTESRIVADKFASTPLINKFANVSNDSEFTKKWEHWMKSYTSGTVVVEPKFHKLTSLPATAKMISTCNQMQRIQDTSGASEQRYRIFEFRNPLVDTGETSQSDKMCPAYWCDPERRKGIIGWMLRGLRMALAEGILEPSSMKQSKHDAISEADPLYRWVKEELETCPGNFISTTDMVAKLPEDVEKNTPQHIGPMVERIWKVKKTRQKGKRGFAGLAFKS